MNQFVFLFLILVLAIGLPLFFKISNSIEGYSNYTLDQAFGDFPQAQKEVLVQDTYPSIGKNQISDNSAYDIWWHYPVFKVGSFDQITNNIRFPHNPDEGTCMPASMCGAVYHDKFIQSNYIKQLPPVKVKSDATRIGYFNSDVNLMTFRTDKSNILY